MQGLLPDGFARVEDVLHGMVGGMVGQLRQGVAQGLTQQVALGKELLVAGVDQFIDQFRTAQNANGRRGLPKEAFQSLALGLGLGLRRLHFVGALQHAGFQLLVEVLYLLADALLLGHVVREI